MVVLGGGEEGIKDSDEESLSFYSKHNFCWEIVFLLQQNYFSLLLKFCCLIKKDWVAFAMGGRGSWRAGGEAWRGVVLAGGEK